MLYDLDINNSHSMNAFIDRLCYLRDPSKIRSYIVMQRGSAPHMNAIKRRLRKYELARAAETESKGYGYAIKTWKCAHTREAHNQLLTDEGTIVCRTCKQERAAKAATCPQHSSESHAAQQYSNYEQQVYISQIADHAVTVFNVARLDLTGRASNELTVDARNAVYLVARERGFSRAAIAAVFGRADYGSITRGVHAANALMRRSEAYKTMVAVLDRMFTMPEDAA